ncbi:hypothetical protein CAT7_02904 [Carnobacterium sp. AT7]|nr:hypothetical protein [Carnobacterium sp. AT7]EDP68396.1 hypothetical protein CAT7_02904 [Carnobacterium sp. AT7]
MMNLMGNLIQLVGHDIFVTKPEIF